MTRRSNAGRQAPFRSTMVVSMRGIPARQVADACRISGYYPSVMGLPYVRGDPAAIGIEDIAHPTMATCRFWNRATFQCSGRAASPQAAVMASKPEFAITHAPGHMFITDKRDLEATWCERRDNGKAA